MSGPVETHRVGQNPRAVLTPYLIPASLHGRKVQNLGDGLILRAIERLLGRFDPARTFSPRAELPSAAQAVLEQCPEVILAGANQLSDHFTVWPGLTAERIRKSRCRFVPFGIGLHGSAGFTKRLSEPTREVLLALHERLEYSSWRCPHTVAYLARELPQLTPKLLMTGCPVVYDRPLLDGAPFGTTANRIAVTVTERHDFWARETATLDFVARRFPGARRDLVLHQNWSPPTRFEPLRHRFWPAPAAQLDDYQRLRQYAVRRGFRIVCPPDVDACLAYYRDVDLHIGSRLHAHLLCLSRCKRSWLVPVDGRAAGMAEFFGFPLCQPAELDQQMGFDFEVVRARARVGFTAMRRFVGTLQG